MKFKQQVIGVELRKSSNRNLSANINYKLVSNATVKKSFDGKMLVSLVGPSEKCSRCREMKELISIRPSLEILIGFLAWILQPQCS